MAEPYEQISQPAYGQTMEPDAKPCSCEKKTCLLGIASIAIGMGGFILAHIL